MSIQAAKIVRLSAENDALVDRLSNRQAAPAVRPVTASPPATAPAVSSAIPATVKGAAPATTGRPPAERRERRGPKWAELHEMERRYERDARLTALADKLGLDENQLSIIAASMVKADEDRKALWESGGPGKPLPEKARFEAIEKTRDATIAAVISEDQQLAYEQFQLEEAQNRQENYANRLLAEMGSLHLSADQKDRLFAVFAAQAAQSETDQGPGAWAQTLQGGQVDNLREILSADQLRLWQQRADAWNGSSPRGR